VASLYAEEKIPLGVVEALRRLGQDVLTALDAGQANRAILDHEVLEFATGLGRAVLTLNRWQFIGLHSRVPRHSGIVVCTQGPNVERQAAAIHEAVQGTSTWQGLLLRINPPPDRNLALTLPAGRGRRGRYQRCHRHKFPQVRPFCPEDASSDVSVLISVRKVAARPGRLKSATWESPRRFPTHAGHPFHSPITSRRARPNRSGHKQ
jgi:hypothetical protein